MKKSILQGLAFSAVLAAPVVLFNSCSPKDPAPSGGQAPNVAASSHDHGHSHDHGTPIPAGIAAILKEIGRQQASLTQTVNDKKLGDAHDYAFAIRDLAKSLAGKVPEVKKAAVTQLAQEITEIAANIDKAATAGAQKSTEAGITAMGVAITKLQSTVMNDH